MRTIPLASVLGLLLVAAPTAWGDPFVANPPMVQFPPTRVGTASQVVVVALTNSTARTINARAAAATYCDRMPCPFQVTSSLGSWDAPASLLMAPGQSVDLNLTFAPARATAAKGGVAVLYDDNAEQVINVAGQGAPADGSPMATLDDKLVFSAQALGQPAYGSLDVVNLGTRPLTITSVTFDNPAFSLDAALNALNNPFDVAPGKTGYVAVDFVPTEFGHLTATATILAVEDGPLRLSLPIDAMTTVDTVCHGYCGPRGVQGGCGLDRHHPLLEGALRPLLLFGSIALALRRRRRVEGALASK